MQNMTLIKDNQPPIGTLCVVYLPVGINSITKETSGPTALAYKTEGGWKMADTPSPLRGLLGEVGPTHWREFV